MTEQWDEADRLAALSAYDILDTQPEAVFDDIVILAARLCDTSMAVISLVDGDRQWFKARVGIDPIETERDLSFCDLTMREPGTTVVPDARLDPRFADNTFVTGEPRVRFYAGAPLRSAEGLPLGSLSVLDATARPEGLTPLQLQALEVLSRQVTTHMELRRALRERRESQERLERALAASVHVGAWEWDLIDDHFVGDERFARICDVDPDLAARGAPVSVYVQRLHPDDAPRVLAAYQTAMASGEPFEEEYRVGGDDARWVLGRGEVFAIHGGKALSFAGTVVDITARKRDEQARELLSQELSHRIKNIFAVVSALTALSARQFPEARAFAETLRTRIAALARAHEFVRPHTEASRPTVGAMTLHAFLTDLFKPYAGPDGAPQVVLSGDDAAFDDQAATSVALLFHELATNAAKYGALSVEDGQVLLTTRRQGDRFILSWEEKGGPPVAGPPDRSGFGSSLAALSVEGQLGGKLERLWAAGGLRVTADLPATALSRRRAAQIVA